MPGMNPANPLDDHDRAAAAVTGIIAAVRPEQLEPSTAYTERTAPPGASAAGRLPAFPGREPVRTGRR